MIANFFLVSSLFLISGIQALAKHTRTHSTKLLVFYGEDIILPCPDTTEATSFIWKHGNDLDPENVFTHKDGRENTELQHPSYRGRVSLVNSDVDDNDASLLLRRATWMDEGVYICTRYYNDALLDIYEVELKFKIDSTKLLVLYGEDIILPRRDTTKVTSFIWKHGNDLDPEYVFTHKDGRENTELQHPSYRGRVSLVNSAVDDNDASLLLRRATWMDEGIYICTRYNNDALLDIYEVELKFKIDSTKLLVFYGEDIILPRRDPTKVTSFIWKHGNDPDPEYVFTHKDGRENTELQHPSYRGRVSLVNSAVDDNDASLLLRRATWMDEGVYICTRYNNDALLDIYEVELKFKIDSTKLLVFYGEDIILPRRDPTKVTSFIWKHGNDLDPEYVFTHKDGRENTELQHPSYRGRVSLVNSAVDDNDASLLLRRATWTDKGIYICKRYNNDALLDIYEVELQVQIALKVLSVNYGEDVVLPCRDPLKRKVSDLTWKRIKYDSKNVFIYVDDQETTKDQHPSYKGRVSLVSRDMEDGDASLLLTRVTSADVGIYYCKCYQNDVFIVYLTVVSSANYYVTIMYSVLIGVAIILIISCGAVLYGTVEDFFFQYRLLFIFE